jgi:predicted Zn-dependent protease
MTEQTKTRRQKLEQLLAKNPKDAFTLYGLALECTNAGDFAAADIHFRALLQFNPDYVPGYQMYAQALAQNNCSDEAKTILTEGIHVADRLGNPHARSEMEAMLADLG